MSVLRDSSRSPSRLRGDGDARRLWDCLCLLVLGCQAVEVRKDEDGKTESVCSVRVGRAATARRGPRVAEFTFKRESEGNSGESRFRGIGAVSTFESAKVGLSEASVRSATLAAASHPALSRPRLFSLRVLLGWA